MSDQEYTCVVSGIPFSTEKAPEERANPFGPSLDRIDPQKGYTPENTRIVALCVNYAKSDFSDDVLLRMCLGVVRTFKKQCKRPEGFFTSAKPK